MVCPNFSEEKKLWKNGYNFVAGIDEAGRGPLAGPVVAASVIIKPGSEIFKIKINDSKKPRALRNSECSAEHLFFKNKCSGFNMVKDSKKLSPRQREEVYTILTNHKDVKWGAGVVSEKMIDKINILQATKLAMRKSFKKLSPDFLLIDGNFLIGGEIGQKGIIKGDSKVFSISAASIIAKVTRDRLMQKYHKKYPKYNFLQNKGYGTKAHFASLQKFGPCRIHRKSFRPVRSL